MTGRSKLPIVILTLTEVAAFNIDGIMIYFGLSILIVNDTKYLDINGE